MALDIQKIEDKIDRTELGAIEVSDTLGGAGYRNLSELLEFGKMMSTTALGVPKHLRGEVGACVRVVMQALEWRMSPFAVADKSYSVNDKIAYEAQLIHAVVESRAPLQRRLRFAFDGEGETRVCIVTGMLKGEVDPLEYRSPPFGKIHPKNSPLWKTDPDQQHIYYSVRAWARRFVPDVLLGIYSRDELEDAGEFTGPDKAKDVTPKPGLSSRLKGTQARGFDAGHVEKETTSLKQSAAALPVEPMEVPDAYEAGRKLKEDGKPLDIPDGLDAAASDAFRVGYEAGADVAKEAA